MNDEYKSLNNNNTKTPLNILTICLFLISAYFFGMAAGIKNAHKNAINIGAAEYKTDTNNNRIYLYWNTTNGWIKEW